MKRWIPLLLLLALLLTACGGTETGPSPDAQEGSPQEETAREEIAEPTPEPAPEPTPEPTPGPLVFPDGTEHDRQETALDLSWLEHGDVPAVIELLAQMPALQTVDLGADRTRSAEEANGTATRDRTDGDEDDEELWWPYLYYEPYGEKRVAEEWEKAAAIQERLSWADIRSLQEAAPQAEFAYRFRFCGKDFSLADESMDLNHRTMKDKGATVREILPCMKHCRYLDMDSCGVTDEVMAAIRDENPQMEVVWRIWFGLSGCMSVRTDVERILASEPGMCLEDGNTKSLKYCTKVKLLDMGHQGKLHDWSFLGYMPELEVAVISIGGWTDLSFMGNCTKLEYLEMCSRTVKGKLDISFLANLKDLKHLDICCLGDGITGYEALEQLTGLERLWIGRFTRLPKNFVAGLWDKLPDTDINTVSETGCEGFWRYTDGAFLPCERYKKLCEQFDYIHYYASCSRYYNDPDYYPHD